MLISISLYALLNTYMSLKTAFNTKRRSVRTRSPSSSATTLIITLTSTLMSNIIQVGAPSTFTSSLSVLAV